MEINLLFFRKKDHYQNGSKLMWWLVDRQGCLGGYFLLNILTDIPKICICYGILFREANIYYFYLSKMIDVIQLSSGKQEEVVTGHPARSILSFNS